MTRGNENKTKSWHFSDTTYFSRRKVQVDQDSSMSIHKTITKRASARAAGNKATTNLSHSHSGHNAVSPQSPLDRDRSPSYSIVLPIFFSPKNERLRHGETERKGSEGTRARDSERARGIACVRQKEAIIRTRGGGGWARNVKRGSKHRRRGRGRRRGAGALVRHATERMIGLAGRASNHEATVIASLGVPA